MASENIEELLFFDTFSHDSSEEINLDLVQFPKPVLISEIRIIPLGARVQADFPGGFRLGATNPSQFHIEFFVNDLSKPGASTFESVGGLEYRENVDIQLECGQRKIPTDGLVLRGWYTTITLAVYGVLSKGIPAPPPPAPVPVPVPDRRPGDIPTNAATAEWVQQHAQVADHAQDNNLYIDQSYNYPPEYQPPPPEHPYVEGWPGPNVPPPSVSLPNDGYPQPPPKEYEAQPPWDPVRGDAKSWDQHPPKEKDSKPDHTLSPSRSLPGEPQRDWGDKRDDRDEKEKPRSRDDRDKYWDESSDIRDDRERSKARDDRREKDLDDRGRDRRSDKDREWRRRDDDRNDDRDRYRDRDKDRKEREGSAKDECSRDRGIRDERSRMKDRERERSNLRDERSSGSNSRSRRDRDRSLDRGSWHDRNVDSSESRSRSSKNYRENSWEKEDRRERERSPCSDNSSYRRRPRSPPSRSPKRPYTPTERFWSPEHPRETEYNSPNNRSVSHESHEERRRSPPVLSPSKSKVSENLKIDMVPALSVQTPLLSPAKYPRTPVRSQSPAYGHSPLPQDEPSLDDEQFEPILSDEDIIDESDSQYQDIDYDFPDDMEEVVKQFNPFAFQVQPMEYFLDPSLTACEKEKIYASKAKSESKSTELSQIRSITVGIKIDDKSNIKEDWVQAVESLLPLLEKGLARVGKDDPLIRTLISWVDVGLNLDLALVHSQPGFKVRHVKSGIRLTESLCWCGSLFSEDLVTKESVQQKLLQLFHRDYMALSIKLMILKALDSTFINEKSIKYFLVEKFPLNGESLTGYQHLLKMLEGKQSVRVKFSLTSLIKKIHIYEMLENLKESIERSIKKDETEYENEVGIYLKEIERIYADADVLLSQPKRFLPVQSQFEINVASPSTYVFLYKYFKANKLLEIFLILLSNRKTNPSITTTVQNLLKSFSERQDGLLFLSSNHEVTNNILKILCCQTAEEYIEVIPGTTVYFGVEVTCRLQILQLLDKLFYCDGNDENGDLFDLVHELYCVSFTPIGKIQVAFVLSLSDNIQILLNIIERSDKKSSVRNYLYDILILIVKYSDDVNFLKKYGKGLLELAEEDKQSHFYDVIQWLKPLETENIVSYEDVGPLCDILKKYTNLENCVALPGDLITCVRILKYLAIPKNENDLSVQTYDEEYLELKYKYVVLQLYSLDCLTHLNTILTKILEYYEQPFVHSINLLSPQGTTLLSFVEPCIMLMRRMLTYVISVRNNEYKDLTHVNTLIEVFTLMQAVPPNAECYLNAQKICRDIVETLLAYTQPVAAENATESETFTKSLWTMMISEVLKYITKSSFTFIPGFLLLSELLPLPIPIPSRHELTKSEINHIVNSRKLWSAHLHTLSPIIHDLIATMAGSSYAPLLQLVRRVCLQLADLAAPTALVICKSVLDPLLSTLQKPPIPNQQGIVWEIPCTPHALRLFNFLACLVSHSSIKASVLSLLTLNNTGKGDERFLTLVNGFSAILRTPSSVVTHTQVQEHVILIIQALFDSDVTLVPVSTIEAKEDVSVNDTFLANALPNRDLLGNLVTALLDHVATPENSFITILSALKTFLLLTEHDYGFYHLKNCIDMKNEAIWSLLIRICNSISRENNECLTVLCTAVELFRELVTVGELVEVSGLNPRTISMSVTELAAVLKWNWEDDEKPHPILHLESLLKEWSATDDSFVSLCETLEDFVKLLNAEGSEKPAENKAETVEPILPQVMPLMAQFSSRPVYIVGDIDDKRLNSVYWLSPPSCDDSDQEMDQIQCDLMELTSSFLPDLHLPHEVERICMLKSTDDEEDPKKPQASKYHFSGVRTRRPFITPMRGRGIGRAAPQRGDLFRSRPPNTSRPPSLHVDDFVALETCGQQPTGPTGYNKISMRAVKDILATRTRGRGRAYAPERGRFFGAQTYPRRDSPRGVLRGRGSWLQHEDVASSRVFHPAERLGLRAESSLGRFLGRGRGVSSWNTRNEQFGGMPIRGVRKEPARHSRTFSR